MDYTGAEITIPTRGEAEDVIAELKALINRYKKATISDLNDLLGFHSVYTDELYGWTDLSTASVKPVLEGYLLELPKTESLD